MSTRAPERPRPAAEIDPRIRARRLEVRRDQSRRRLHRIAVLGFVVAGVAGLWGLTLTPLLDVDHIRIQGADRTGADPVLAVIDIERGDALVTADVGGAAAALTRLPWIATAEVRRSWPGTVTVTVVEREPVAAVRAAGGGWVVVDRSGRQLAVEREPALELVRIAGRPITVALGDAVGARFQGSVELAAVAPPSLRPVLRALWPQRDGSMEATVVLPTGSEAVVRFGSPTQLEAKLLALAAVLERADLGGVRLIDLRVPGVPALTRG